jgi:hypothetical protein
MGASLWRHMEQYTHVMQQPSPDRFFMLYQQQKTKQIKAEKFEKNVSQTKMIVN